MRETRQEASLGTPCYGLLLMLGLVLSACAGNLMATPALNATSSPTPSVVRPPDPRIRELRDTFGIELDNQFCAAPCLGNAPKTPLTLGEFVKRVGPPEKVYSFVNGPSYEYFVTLIYASRGFEVFARRPIDDNATDMTPTMEVFRVDLWNSRNLTDMTRELWEVDKLRIPLDRAPDWSGFGPVQELPQ